MDRQSLNDEQKVRVLLAHRALILTASRFEQLVSSLKAEINLPSDWVLDIDTLEFTKPQKTNGVNGHAMEAQRSRAPHQESQEREM